jgi:hypothetical protein
MSETVRVGPATVNFDLYGGTDTLVTFALWDAASIDPDDPDPVDATSRTWLMHIRRTSADTTPRLSKAFTVGGLGLNEISATFTVAEFRSLLTASGRAIPRFRGVYDLRGYVPGVDPDDPADDTLPLIPFGGTFATDLEVTRRA